MAKSSMWVERYRPKTLDEIIFENDRQEEHFRTYIENGDIPNLFLSGIHGTGKTSVASVLVKELGVDPDDVVKINSSKDKIDAIRDRVDVFSQTLPSGKFKVVRLEEIDHLSLDGQALLRGLIDDVASNCRFIATCNSENRVIPALKDRFQRYSFKAPNKDKIIERMLSILAAEGANLDQPDLIELLDKYVAVGYPSVRSITQLLQKNFKDGKLLKPGNETNADDWRFSLLEILAKNDWETARKLVCEQSSKEEHESVFRFLYENVDKLKVKDKNAAIITIAEYLYKHNIVADTEINLAALFITLGTL